MSSRCRASVSRRVRSPSLASSLGQLGHGRRRRRDVLAEQPADDPVAALHRAGAQARASSWSGRPPSAAARRGRTRSASSTRTHSSGRRSGIGHAVVLRQRRVDERVRRRRGSRAPSGRCWTTSTKKRIGSSNIACAQLVVEAREPLAVDAVVLLEAAEVEPVAAELGGQAADAVVAAASAGPAAASTSGRCRSPAAAWASSSRVGHARPEEVAQPAGQRVVRQRPRRPRPARPGRSTR